MNIKRRIRLLSQSLIHPNRTIDILSSLNSSEGIKKEITLPSRGSINILLPDEVSILLYLKEKYEPEVTAFMDEVLEPGMTVFDIGAHIGYHSLMARGRVSESGSVICFEPIPCLYGVLKLNCQPYENMTPEEIAINDGSSLELILNYFGIRYVGYTTVTKPRIDRSTANLPIQAQISVSATSIDNYVTNKRAIPHLIKVDIEGGEMNALRGAKNTITKHKPFIIFEGGDLGRTPENNTRACLDYLIEFGYYFYEFDHKKSVVIPHEPKQVYYGCYNILCVPKPK